jgi:hypothetical protein
MDENSDTKILESFYKNILSKENWFVELLDNNSVDLLLFTGSRVSGENDEISDLDIFLISPQSAQKKFNLRPVYSYEYNGEIIEISMCIMVVPKQRTRIASVVI